MLKQFIKHAEVTETKDVVDHAERYCDVCGGRIVRGFYDLDIYHSDADQPGLTHSTFDICSAECLDVKYQEFLKKTAKTQMTGADIVDTFEIDFFPKPLRDWEREEIVDDDMPMRFERVRIDE